MCIRDRDGRARHDEVIEGGMIGEHQCPDGVGLTVQLHQPGAVSYTHLDVYKRQAQNKTGLHEAAVTAVGRIGGVACVAAVLDLSLIHICQQA